MPGGFGGVPQKVGKEFAAADQAKKTPSRDGLGKMAKTMSKRFI